MKITIEDHETRISSLERLKRDIKIGSSIFGFMCIVFFGVTIYSIHRIVEKRVEEYIDNAVLDSIENSRKVASKWASEAESYASSVKSTQHEASRILRVLESEQQSIVRFGDSVGLHTKPNDIGEVFFMGVAPTGNNVETGISMNDRRRNLVVEETFILKEPEVESFGLGSFNVVENGTDRSFTFESNSLDRVHSVAYAFPDLHGYNNAIVEVTDKSSGFLYEIDFQGTFVLGIVVKYTEEDGSISEYSESRRIH